MSAGWPAQRLKFILDINRSSLPDDEDPWREIQYIEISAVGRGSLITEPQVLVFGDAPSRARRIVHEGDTIVSTVRTYLRAVLPIRADLDGCVASTGFAVLTPGSALDPRFLGWWAQGDPFVEEVVARSVGVSYPAINAPEIGDLLIRLPSLREQGDIADYLDAETARINNIIERRRRTLALMRERLMATISSATGAPCAVDTSASLPTGWTSVLLARCFDSVEYGIGEAARESGAIAVLAMGNIDDDGRVVPPPGGFVDAVRASLLLRPGDLLFNRTNSLAKVGKVGLVESIDQPTTVASYLVVIRPSHLADNDYLRYLLNSTEVLRLGRSMALPSIGQANLNPSRYGTIRVPLPPVDDQRRIASALNANFQRYTRTVEAIIRQIDLLGERRSALITAAVSGGVRPHRRAA